MSRDPTKLRVFHLADRLVPEIYRVTSAFPAAERFGLQSQLRRAAVSAAVTIVEGCARRTTGEYLNFLNIATGSSAEARYLLELAGRLDFLPAGSRETLMADYTELLKSLQKLIRSLSDSRA